MLIRMVGLCVGDSCRVARREFWGHPDLTRCTFYMDMKMIHPCMFMHPIYGTLVVLLRNESLQKFGCITLQVVWETFLPAAKGAWERISLLYQSSWKRNTSPCPWHGYNSDRLLGLNVHRNHILYSLSGTGHWMEAYGSFFKHLYKGKNSGKQNKPCSCFTPLLSFRF